MVMGMREKLIELLSESVSKFCKLSVIRGTTKITAISVNADEFADHLIANGVTIPVRCKDCQYGMYAGLGKFMCELHEFVGKAYFYCADGERRTDETL